MAEARAEGLPAEVLQTRVREGRAKGADEARIVEVLGQELARLRASKRILEEAGWAPDRPRVVLLATAMAAVGEEAVRESALRSKGGRDFGVLRRRLGVAMFLASLGADAEAVRRTMAELESSGGWFESEAATHRLKRMLLEAHRAGEDVGRPGAWMSRLSEERRGVGRERREGLRRGEGHRWKEDGGDGRGRRGGRP